MIDLGDFGFKWFHLFSILLIPFFNISFFTKRIFIYYGLFVISLNLASLAGVVPDYDPTIKGIFRYFFWFYCIAIGYSVTLLLRYDVYKILILTCYTMFFLILIKNLYYTERIVGLWQASGSHPQAGWNYYNTYTNVNREVATLTFYSIFLLITRKNYFVYIYSLLNSFISKVLGAILMYLTFYARKYITKIRWVVIFLVLFSSVLFTADLKDYFEYGSYRVYIWSLGAISILSFDFFNIVIGKGLGSAVHVFESFSHNPFGIEFEALHERYEEFHNMFLTFFYEQGLFGIIGILFFIALPVFKSFNINGADKGFKGLNLMLILMFLYGLITSYPADPIFSLFFGVSLGLKHIKGNEKENSDYSSAT